jgi:hypothetical protein
VDQTPIQRKSTWKARKKPSRPRTESAFRPGKVQVDLVPMGSVGDLERTTGFEPATPTLAKALDRPRTSAGIHPSRSIGVRARWWSGADGGEPA